MSKIDEFAERTVTFPTYEHGKVKNLSQGVVLNRDGETILRLIGMPGSIISTPSLHYVKNIAATLYFEGGTIDQNGELFVTVPGLKPGRIPNKLVFVVEFPENNPAMQIYEITCTY